MLLIVINNQWVKVKYVHHFQNKMGCSIQLNSNHCMSKTRLLFEIIKLLQTCMNHDYLEFPLFAGLWQSDEWVDQRIARWTEGSICL